MTPTSTHSQVIKNDLNQRKNNTRLPNFIYVLMEAQKGVAIKNVVQNTFDYKIYLDYIGIQAK